MDRLRNVEWLDEPLLEARECPQLTRWMREEAPSVHPNAEYLSDCPWIVRADFYLDEPYIHINDIASLIYLTVSRDNSCRFCYGAVRLLMRLGGMSQAEIERVERDIETAATEPRIQLALDFARRVSRSNPPPGAAEKQALRAVGFDEVGIMEIAFQAADVIFHNRAYTLTALPVVEPEIVDDKGVFAELREHFAGVFAQTAAPARPEKLRDDLKTGPFSNVVLALDGIQQARILRTIIDEAWASPFLPSRTKALIFAVIARGLASEPAEREARRLLADEGLAEDRVDEILAHLSSPELEENETRILPYVRETIWYQAPAVQRRGRELRSTLSNGEFLETVGIAALANMICRLPLAIDVD